MASMRSMSALNSLLCISSHSFLSRVLSSSSSASSMLPSYAGLIIFFSSSLFSSSSISDPFVVAGTAVAVSSVVTASSEWPFPLRRTGGAAASAVVSAVAASAVVSAAAASAVASVAADSTPESPLMVTSEDRVARFSTVRDLSLSVSAVSPLALSCSRLLMSPLSFVALLLPCEDSRGRETETKILITIVISNKMSNSSGGGS